MLSPPGKPRFFLWTAAALLLAAQCGNSIEIGIRTGWPKNAISAEVFEALKLIDAMAEWPAASLVTAWAGGIAVPEAEEDDSISARTMICGSFNFDSESPVCSGIASFALTSPLLGRVVDALVANHYFAPALAYQSHNSDAEFQLIAALGDHNVTLSRGWYSVYRLDANGRVAGAGLTSDFDEGYESCVKVVEDAAVADSLKDLLTKSDVWRLSRHVDLNKEGEFKIFHSGLVHTGDVKTFAQFVKQPLNGFRFHSRAPTYAAGEEWLTDWTGGLVLKNAEYKTLNETPDDKATLSLKAKPTDDDPSHAQEETLPSQGGLTRGGETKSLTEIVEHKTQFDNLGAATILYVRKQLQASAGNSVCSRYIENSDAPKLSCLRGISSNILTHLPHIVSQNYTAEDLRAVKRSTETLSEILRTRINSALVDGKPVVTVAGSVISSSHQTKKLFLCDFLRSWIWPIAIKDEMIRQSLERWPEDLASILRHSRSFTREPKDLIKHTTNHIEKHGFYGLDMWKSADQVGLPRSLAKWPGIVSFDSPYRDPSLSVIKAVNFVGESHYTMLTGKSVIEIGRLEPKDFPMADIHLSISKANFITWLKDLLQEMNSNGIHWFVDINDDPAANFALQKFVGTLPENTEEAAQALERFITTLKDSGVSGVNELFSLPQGSIKSLSKQQSLISVNGRLVDIPVDEAWPSAFRTASQITELIEEDLVHFVRSLTGMVSSSETRRFFGRIKSHEHLFGVLKHNGIKNLAAQGAWTNNMRPSARVFPLKQLFPAQMLEKSTFMTDLTETQKTPANETEPLPILPLMIIWNPQQVKPKRAGIVHVLDHFATPNTTFPVHIHLSIIEENRTICYPKLSDDPSALHEDINCVGEVPVDADASIVVGGALKCYWTSRVELEACLQDLIDMNVSLLNLCLENNPKGCMAPGMLRGLAEATEKSAVEEPLGHVLFSSLYPPTSGVDDVGFDKILFGKPSLRHLRLSSPASTTTSKSALSDIGFAPVNVKFLIDPLSVPGQIASRLAEYLNLYLKIDVQVLLTSDIGYQQLPLNRWTQHLLAPTHMATLEEDKASKPTQRINFANNLTSEVLTFDLKSHPKLHVRSHSAAIDMDNIILTSPATQAASSVDYRIHGIRLEGQMHIGGVKLKVYNSTSNEVVDETLSIERPNYFQLQLPRVGDYRIGIEPGEVMVRSEPSELKEAVEQRRLTIKGDANATTISVRSWEDIKAFGEHLRLVPEVSERPGGSSSVYRRTKPGERIHVFSLASGHMYERLLRIMMLSARENTKRPITFWILEDFLSPNFRETIPMNKYRKGLNSGYESDFEIRYVHYGWPSWLRQQSEKQRDIWARKILFLDVLFPLDLDQVIYVDADQIVRGDLGELWDLDMGLNEMKLPYVYGFTPFCESNEATKQFRFWTQGFWLEYLSEINEFVNKEASHRATGLVGMLSRGWQKLVGKSVNPGMPNDGKKKYHISALFKVNLKEFRRQHVGDILRSTYNRLTLDPNSLANLDQDLPNSVQHLAPIYSLDMKWLWCETWCSMDSKNAAMTIDLCNNPLTHEPKLAQAQRIAPEWTAYDAFINGNSTNAQSVRNEEL